MKRVIVLMLAVLPVLCYAQSKFGFKGGLSLGFDRQTIFMTDHTPIPKIGGVVGVFYRYQKGYFIIAPEVNFSMKGQFTKPIVTLTNSQGQETGRVTARASSTFLCLDFPVLAGVQIKRLYIVAGPSFGFNLSGRFKMTYPLNDGPREKYTEKYPDLGIFSFEIQEGVGYTFPVGKRSLLLELRHGIGLTTFSYGEVGSGRHNYVYVLTGFIF